MNPTIVHQHPATVDAYLRHGWKLVPIPPGTKGPTRSGWNREERTIQSSAELPPGFGIGLAHAFSGTMALDIDEWDTAAFRLSLHGIDLQSLYEAPDAVIIHSGNPGHGKLLYSMPFGLALRSKKLTHRGQDGVNHNYLDFRCATANRLTVQDVLPPSMHPTTGQPYRWAGRGNWQSLPEIPPMLLDYWRGLLDEEDQSNSAIPTGDAIPSNWTEVHEALSHISPDCSRDEWINVGMALHYAGMQTNDMTQALTLWDSWSARSVIKYPGQRAILTQWTSFRPDKTHLVKLGTLFHYARQAGWTRRIDASKLFSEVAFSPTRVAEAIRPAPPDLDLDLWPSLLATRSREVANAVGCDPLVPLLAGLGAVCGVVDARTRLELLPGYRVPPLLWLMTIGEPADKKSPGSHPMLDVLTRLEQEDVPRCRRAETEFEGAEAFFNVARKAWLDQAASAEAQLNGQIVEPPAKPAPPVPLRLRVMDATSQKVVRIAADRPQGVVLHLDEMASWLRKMADPRSGEDRSCWVQAYESKPYVMDRVGSGTIRADNLACSIFGNIQPRVFRKLLPSLNEDGLVQRFIPVILRAGATRRGEPIPAYMTHEQQWEDTLRFLFALPTMEYRLSEAAYKIFRQFQSDYERQKHDERITRAGYAYITAFGKLEGTCGRLALILHMLEEPYSLEVSGPLMLRVVKIIWDYIVPSMRYTYTTIGGTSEFEGWLVEHILNICDVEVVSLRDIATAGVKYLADLNPREIDAMIYAGMAVLESSEWVKRVDDGTKEHARVAQWAINPGLAAQFRGYREEVTDARKRLLRADGEARSQFIRKYEELLIGNR